MKIFYLAEHIFAGAFFAVAYYLAFSKYRKFVFNVIGMFIYFSHFFVPFVDVLQFLTCSAIRL